MTGAARIRRAVARELAVDVAAVLNLIGAMLKYLSVAFLLPLVLAVGYGEPPWPFLAGGAVAGVGGWAL